MSASGTLFRLLCTFFMLICSHFITHCRKSYNFLTTLLTLALKGRVIHGAQFWTAPNVADGLNVLTICIEPWVPFFPCSCFLADEYADDLSLSLYYVGFWAFTWNMYQMKPGELHISIYYYYYFFALTHLRTAGDFTFLSKLAPSWPISREVLRAASAWAHG